MELREFAETVLHGRRLAEKLVHADTFTDRNPGAPSPLQLPGRPPELEFATTGRDELPAAQALADPVAAGRLLHRFANHELLAPPRRSAPASAEPCRRSSATSPPTCDGWRRWG